MVKQNYLVTAYSLSPLCREVGEKVPIHPRSRRSLPNFQVTKSGLQREIFKQSKTPALILQMNKQRNGNNEVLVYETCHNVTILKLINVGC